LFRPVACLVHEEIMVAMDSTEWWKGWGRSGARCGIELSRCKSGGKAVRDRAKLHVGQVAWSRTCPCGSIGAGGTRQTRHAISPLHTDPLFRFVGSSRASEGDGGPGDPCSKFCGWVGRDCGPRNGLQYRRWMSAGVHHQLRARSSLDPIRP